MANPSYHHLYNSAAWKRLRAQQLREHPLCRLHLELGRTVVASVVDHVEPHRGDLELFLGGRLQSLCKPCHDGHKQAQEHQADGLMRGAGLDGRPLDLAHPWHKAPNPSSPGGVEKSEAHQPTTGLCSFFAGCQNSEGGSKA